MERKEKGGAGKMIKKILVYFQSSEGMDNILEYAKLLEEKYNAQIGGIYVKDVRKYEIITPAVEGVVVDSAAGYAFSEWEKIEEKAAKDIEEKFRKYFDKSAYFVEDGISSECVARKLKGYDMLMMTKGEKICNDIKNFMKMVFKPLLIVPNKKIAGIDKILFANDGGIYANRSIVEFLNYFDGIKKITAIEVGIDSDDETNQYIAGRGIELDIIKQNGDPVNAIVKEAAKYDIMIMGNLKYFFLLEKLTGKTGANILEKADIPVFIG